jgi:hypothetical protein
MLRHHTPLSLEVSPLQLSYQDHLLTLGSCFAQNLGQRLQEQLYPILINPFGVLYNPCSIAQSLQLLLSDQWLEPKDLVFHQEAWHSWYHHSSFSGTNQQATLEDMNQQLKAARQHLQQTRCLFLTFGTAWIYTWKATNQVVSNCHRFPAQQFERRRLGVEEIVRLLKKALTALHAQLGPLDILFTISPVRHLKDGFVENQTSKATLVLAVQQLVQEVEAAHYFPAYELLLDDLRDYRYYARDLVHPNELAIDYIAQAFEQRHLKKEEQTLRQQVAKLQRAAQHRPRQPHSQAHQQFLQQQLNQLEKIAGQLPIVSYQQLKAQFMTPIL